MVRHDGAEAKKQRMEQMARNVLSALTQENELPLSNTVAGFEYAFGLTRERIVEYLETLEKLGRFTLDKERDKICKANQEKPK